MNRRQLRFAFFIAVILTLVCIFFFDQPVADFMQRVGAPKSTVLQEGTRWLEFAFGYPLGRYFLCFLLLGLGAILGAVRSTRRISWIFLFAGSVELTTRLTTGILKNVFGRLRPFQVIQAGNWDWKFFSGHGDAFPSGHSAHFWGLFVPLLFLFPRWRFPLLIIPVFISIGRVGLNAHWCSDVIASAGLAAAFTLVFIWIFRLRDPQGHPPERGGN